MSCGGTAGRCASSACPGQRGQRSGLRPDLVAVRQQVREDASITPGRRLHYSVGMTVTEDMQQAILNVPRASGNLPATPAARCGRCLGR